MSILSEMFFEHEKIKMESSTFSYIDDPSRFQMHQARAEEITLKEDFISVPMPMDDDFGNVNGKRLKYILFIFTR